MFKVSAEDIACPPKLQTGLFTSAAIDSIDHNQSSATATTSFHGTSITIFQHTDHPVQNVPIQSDMNNSITTRTKLPSYYTDIEPSKGGKPETPALLKSEELCLDLTNYARWMSVFIFDLKSLYEKDVYNELCNGHFTVKKSNRAFSSIGEDHAHY